jgi:hypothetical protein
VTRQPWPDAAAMLRLQLTHGADTRTVRNVLEAIARGYLVPEDDDEAALVWEWLARFGEGICS